MIFTKLYAAAETNTWGSVGKAKEKGFFDFELLLGWHGHGKLQRFSFLLHAV